MGRGQRICSGSRRGHIYFIKRGRALGVRGVEIRGNSLRIHFTYNGQRFKERVAVNGQPLAPTLPNIAYAEKLLARVREKIRLDDFNPAEFFGKHMEKSQSESLTVVAFMNYWLDRQRLEDSTIRGYKCAIRFWEKQFKARPLPSLKHGDILRVASQQKELNGKTLNNYVSILRQALNLAVRDGMLDKNPADGVPKYKHQAPPVDPFPQDESDRIIEEIRSRHPEPVYNMVEFWFWTGMRTSEVFGLRWADIDFNKQTALVSQAKVFGKLKSTTKTNVARTVHLNSRSFAAIMRQHKHTGLLNGGVFADPRYFAEWSDERAFRRSFWTPTFKQLGIRYRRPYNMRHSYATAMLMAGMTPAFCAKQLGHSIEMFLRTYARWMDGAQNEVEMARLERSFSAKLPHAWPTAVAGGSQPIESKEESSGVADGTRTHDDRNHNPGLSQLSYGHH